MVCKKEICDWFKEMSSAKRLDLLCGLLHMCLPLERRFLGSFLEDLCRVDFTSLRSEELRSNDRAEILKLSGDLLKKSDRARLNITLSLLYSTNSLCSNSMYKVLLNCIQNLIPCMQSPSSLDKNEVESIFEDVLLLLTLAINHPAFIFAQRIEFSSLLGTIEKLYSNCGLVPQQNTQDNGSNSAVCSRSDSSYNVSNVHAQQNHRQSKPVHVKTIELVNNRSQKSAASKKTQFRIKVTWSNDKVETISKTYQDFVQFHSELIKLFPNDSGAHKPERLIPFLPQEKNHSHAELFDPMAKYVRKIGELPSHFLQCDHVTQFFQSAPEVPEATCMDLDRRGVISHNDRLHPDTPPSSPLVTAPCSNKVEAMEQMFDKEEKKTTDCNDKTTAVGPTQAPVGRLPPPRPAPHVGPAGCASSAAISKGDSSEASSKCSSPGMGGTNSPATVKSLTFYNSHLSRDLVPPEPTNNRAPSGVEGSVRSPRSPAHYPAVHSFNNPVLNNRQLCNSQVLSVMSPHTSPMTSPMSSPYISPSSSVYSGGSRPSSPGAGARKPFSVLAWMKKQRLHKYSVELSKYSLDQFLNLTDEELLECGLTRGAMGRFRTGIETLRSQIRYDGNGAAYCVESSGQNSPVAQYDWNGPLSTAPTPARSYSHASVSAVPSQALFVNNLPDSSSSSCGSDEFTSPAVSPQPQQDSGTHSPQVDLSDSSNGKGPERKIQKIHVPHGKRNYNDRPFAQRHAAAKDTGENMKTRSCHNVSVQTAALSDKYQHKQGLNSVLVRAPRVPQHVFPGMLLPHMLHPGLRSPRPLLGARPELLHPGCVPVSPRMPNGFHLPHTHHMTVHQPMEAASISNGSHNASHYSVPVTATSSVPRPSSLEVQQATHAMHAEKESVTSPGVVHADGPKTSTPGIANVTSSNSSSKESGTTVYQSATLSTTTTTVTYSVTQYQNTSSCSSPVLVSASNGNHSNVASPSPVVLPGPGTIGPPGDSTCSDCAPNACSHVVQTPTTPVHFTYSSQHQPLWHQPNSPHHVFAPHGFPSPPVPQLWNPNSNGFVSPHAGYATMQYNLPTHNGYAVANQLMQSIITPSMAQLMAQGAHFAHPSGGGFPFHGKGVKHFLTCYNCGGPGHKAVDCVESTMDAMSNFSLNMKPKGETVE